MNKILNKTLVFAAALVLASCVSEEDDLFSKSAAERLNEASELYSKRLWASPNGWAMQLYPTKKNEAPFGNGYLLLCDFDEDFSVKVAMNNALTNKTYAEDRSAWEVIADNGPVLSFNTYNKVMHKFSDPEDVPGTESDETGTGIGGDYEFVIVDAPEDASYMMLKGKKRGTYNLLTPLEEGVDYNEYLTDVRDFQNKMFPTDAPTFDVIHFGDSIYKMDDANDGIPNIYPYDGDAVINESFNPFLMTKRGEDYYLRFRDRFEVTEDVSAQDFRYNKEKDIFESVDNAEYYIDGDSPLRFFSSSIDGGEIRWRWSSTSDKSDAFAALYKRVADGFSAVGYTLQNMTIQTLSETLRLGITYRTRNSTGTAYYLLDMVKNDSTVSFNYTGAFNQAAENVKNKVTAIDDILGLLQKELTVTAATTKFNLSSIRLTDTANPDMWFTTAIY